nr:glycosyltransferase family 4 protein [candidate division Zixibacteria bacterium]
MKTAIVYDWLVTYAGAERVLEQIIRLYPEADIFTLYDFIPQGQRGFLLDKPTTTSFLQKFPLARKKYRSYLPLMPLAIEQFDLTGYELVISVSHAVAKGVITGPDQLHIAYVNSPIRYAWDLMYQYLDEAELTEGPKSWLTRLILHYIRNWDVRSSNTVDHFIGNSRFIVRRIKKFYRREAVHIYPPVDIDAFELTTDKDDFYLTASRLVSYKKTTAIVEAFNRMPDKKLIVAGDGPEYRKIKSLAGRNITMTGYLPTAALKKYMQKARAFIFAAEEDFGIVPVEAQACGTPVIAFGKGGCLETVIDRETGLFFHEQTPDAIIEAVTEFESVNHFDPYRMRDNAARFSVDNFRRNFMDFVEQKLTEFTRKRPGYNCLDFNFVSDKIKQRAQSVSL